MPPLRGGRRSQDRRPRGVNGRVTLRVAARRAPSSSPMWRAAGRRVRQGAPSPPRASRRSSSSDPASTESRAATNRPTGPVPVAGSDAAATADGPWVARDRRRPEAGRRRRVRNNSPRVTGSRCCPRQKPSVSRDGAQARRRKPTGRIGCSRPTVGCSDLVACRVGVRQHERGAAHGVARGCRPP